MVLYTRKGVKRNDQIRKFKVYEKIALTSGKNKHNIDDHKHATISSTQLPAAESWAVTK